MNDELFVHTRQFVHSAGFRDNNNHYHPNHRQLMSGIVVHREPTNNITEETTTSLHRKPEFINLIFF